MNLGYSQLSMLPKRAVLIKMRMDYVVWPVLLFLFAIMIGSLLHAVTISKKWVPYVILIALLFWGFSI